MIKLKFVEKIKKFFRKMKFYGSLGILTITAGSATLAGCTKTNNNTPTPTTAIEVTTPTESIEPTLTIAPTNTPTSTPIPTNTPTPTPIPDPTKIKVSIEELMRKDVVFPDFGEIQDVDTEMNKKLNYLKSFNVLSENDSLIPIVFLNECFLTNENVDSAAAEKYLSMCTSNNLEKLPNIMEKIMIYNLNNPDNQIVISCLGIDSALGEYDRIRLNDVQYYTYKTVNENISFNNKICPRAYSSYIYENDGSSKQVSFQLEVRHWQEGLRQRR